MRIHIENDAAGPRILDVSAARLATRLAAIPGLTISEHAAADYDPCPAGDFDALLSCRKLDPAQAKAVSPSLRWIQITTAGAEAWLPTLPDDVILTNASGVHGPKGAQFILAACLMLNFDIPKFASDKQDRAWRPSHGGPIAGRTVTILGVGGIGRDAVAALRPFGVTIIGVTRTGACDAQVDLAIPIEALDSVLPRTDILVSTLPLTPQTRGLLNRERLGRLKPGAGVVNVGRGGVMDHAALADMLTSGLLGGAVLDVFPIEPPPPEDPLWACPRLIMTPHCGLDDHAAYAEACLDIFCANLARFAAGEALANVVDRARGY